MRDREEIEDVKNASRNYLGPLIYAARIARSMTFGDLARACGAITARQTSRIAQRLVLFEREGIRDRKLLQRVIRVLQLDPSHVEELLRLQRDEELAAWEEWADEEVSIELHLRALPGFWCRLPLPDRIERDEDSAIDYARQMTMNRDQTVILALDRRRSIIFTHGQIVGRSEASPERSTMPFMVIGGRRVIIEATCESGFNSGKGSVR